MSKLAYPSNKERDPEAPEESSEQEGGLVEFESKENE